MLNAEDKATVLMAPLVPTASGKTRRSAAWSLLVSVANVLPACFLHPDLSLRADKVTTPVQAQSPVHSLFARTAAWHLQLFLLDLAGQQEAVQVGLNAQGLLNGKPAAATRQCATW